MKAYFQLFEDMFSHLQKNAFIEVQQTELLKPPNEKEVREIEEDFAISLLPEVRQFYKQVGGVKLKWEFKERINIENNEPYQVNGSINILTVREVFWGRKEAGWHNVLWFDHTKLKMKERLVNLKPFDLFDEDDTGCVCFDLIEGSIKETLVLYSVDNGLFDLKLNFENYLKLSIASCGLLGWQFLLAPDSFTASNKNFAGSVEQVLPKIIFDMDIAAFHSAIKKLSNT